MPNPDLDLEFYRDVVALTGDVFWAVRVTPDEHLEFVTDDSISVIGHTPEELIAGGPEFMLTLVDPRDQPVLEQAITADLDHGGYVEFRLQHPVGRTLFMQVWFRRRDRTDGSVVIEGVAREVSALKRLESSLRESEDRFRNAMRSSAVGICLISPAGQFLEVNQAMCDLLGRQESELRNTTWQTLTHPGDLNADVALVDEVLAGRRDSYRLLKRYLRPDKSVVWGDLSVSCVRDDEGRVRYFVTQIVDMTQYMQIEQELRASEEQYRLLVEESSDFLVRTIGTTGIVSWVSPSVTRTIGWKPEEIVGRLGIDFAHPDDREALLARRQDMDAGSRIRGRQRLLCADGRYKWMAQVGRTLFNDEGATIGRITSYRDIDEQVRAEEALAVSQAEAHAERERLRATMNAMLDPHFLITPVRDHTGRIIDFEQTDANDAGLQHVGMTREAFVGTRLLESVPGQRPFFEMYVNAFESGEPMIEDALRFADPQDPTRSRLYDLRGVRVGSSLSITVRDATQRVEAAAALAESQARYRLLAENASDVVFRLKLDGTIEWLSDGVKAIMGRSPQEFLGHDIDEFVYEPDQDRLDEAVDEAMVHGKATVRFRVELDDGELHWLEATVHPFEVEGEEQTVLVGGCRDVHAEMQAIAELDRRARTDQLTGLPNREEAMTQLAQLLGSQLPGPTAVAFLDLDDFKTINDTFGHTVGDKWLKEAADRIRTGVRQGDLVARVGGDEILVVICEVRDLDQAVGHCHRLREALLSEGGLSTVSIGVTLAWSGEDVEAVVARADQAMYKAKQGGRNQVVGA